MQIESIRLFYLSASLKSISRAAAASHISQSALSQQIQRLEEEVGLRLFDRSNRGVELTEAGRVMEKYAKHFTQLYEHLTEDLENLKRSTGTARIVASPVVGIYGLPCTIFKVKERFPQYSFHMSTAPSLEVERRVAARESDIGFIIGPPRGDGLYSKEVFSDRVVLVAAPEVPIGEPLDMDSLKKYPIALLAPGSSFRSQLDRYFYEKGRTLEDYNILFSLDSAESVKSSVLRGHGLAFLPYLSVKKELYVKQLRQINIQDFDMHYKVYIIYSKREETEPSMYELSKYFAKIVTETFC